MPTGRRAPTLDRTAVRRFWVVVLATLCVVVAAQAGPWRPTQRVVELPGTLTATPPPEPAVERGPEPAADPATIDDPAPDLGWVRRVVVVALAAVLVSLLVRWALRRRLPARPPPPEPLPALAPVAAPAADREPDLRVLEEGVRAAAEHLRAAGSPADAVIAAWVALEDAAARSGVVRVPSATATEFTLDVLDRTPADPAAARTLLTLYLRARFDDEPLLADDVAAAGRSARALLETVGRPSRAGGDG